MTSDNFLFQHQGRVVKFTSPFTAPVKDTIDPAVYRIKITEKGEVFLEKALSKFNTPSMLFSDAEDIALIVINAYNLRQGATAALFVGPKGGGKSMTTEIIANTLIEGGIPTILVDGWIHPDILRDTIPRLGPCVVIFDEFGKNFPTANNMPSWGNAEPNTKSQNSLLPLLSNSGLKKVLFLITENKADSINEYIKNRPDRVLFAFSFRTYGINEVNEVFEKTFKKPLSEKQRSFIEEVLLNWTAKRMEYGMDTVRLISALAEQCQDDTKAFIRLAAYHNIPAIEAICFTVTRHPKDAKETPKAFALDKLTDTNYTFTTTDGAESITLERSELRKLFVNNASEFKRNNVNYVSRATWKEPTTNLTYFIDFRVVATDSNIPPVQLTETEFEKLHETCFKYTVSGGGFMPPSAKFKRGIDLPEYQYEDDEPY